jgi:hypothetical protein
MKKNLFLITEEEKRRILGLHQSATKRGYLSEQEQTVQYYKDQTGKVIKLVGNYSAPLGSTPATPEEYDAQNKPVEGGGGQGAKVITNNDKSYDYKEENGKYYYSKKGQNQWVEAKGDINNPKSSLGAIKNLKWDTATPMPSSTNLTPKTPAGPGLSGFNADSDGNGIPDYLQTQNPQDKSALTTPGTQPTGASGVAGTSGVQGTSGVAGTSEVQGTSGVAGTSGVQGTSGVAGTSATLMTGKIKSTQQIRQDYRQQKQNERQGARVVRKNKKELEKELKDLQTNYRRLQNKMTPQDKQSYELRIGQIQTDLGNF